MSLFAEIQPLSGMEVLEEHQFPLFELTGLYQKFRVDRAGEIISGECITVNLHEAQNKSDEEILNLIVASGYVAEDMDISFRIDAGRRYFYAYFNLVSQQ